MASPNGSSPSFTDVLIIGAGPSGLMAGQALARLGVKCRIIDRRQKGALYGNADGFQARTLEVWKSYGMLDELLETAHRIHVILMYKQTERGIEREIPSTNVIVNTRYPFEATVGVETIEGILRKSMEKYGVLIEQPLTPTTLEVLGEDSPYPTHPVKVTLEHTDPVLANGIASDRGPISEEGTAPITHKTEVVYAKYVIGADGAHSWVRRTLGIPMEGDQTEYCWGVVDAHISTDFPDPRFKCILQSSSSGVIVIPREGTLTRIYVQLSQEDIGKTADGRLDKSKLTPEVSTRIITEHIKKSFLPYNIELEEITWYTIFVVTQKVASQFSFRDRVLIVGDACHTHSPKAGQGANASMNDSHNLAWKLAYILRGWSSPSLLDTYELERRQIALDLIAFDKKIARILNSGTAATYKGVWHQQNLYVSGIGVRYNSSLTDTADQELAPNLVVGERLPPGPLVRLGDWIPMDIQDLAPSNGLFKLLIFAGDVLSPNHSDRLQEFADGLTVSEPLHAKITQMLWIGTIVSGKKEALHWRDVAPSLRSWDRVFVDEETGRNPSHGRLYEAFGIGTQGAAVLLRPDGYVSMITRIVMDGGKRIVHFLDKL